jgi:hypothetical protein
MSAVVAQRKAGGAQDELARVLPAGGRRSGFGLPYLEPGAARSIQSRHTASFRAAVRLRSALQAPKGG